MLREAENYFNFCSNLRQPVLPLTSRNAIAWLATCGDAGRPLAQPGAMLGFLANLCGYTWKWTAAYQQYRLLKRGAERNRAPPRATATIPADLLVALIQNARHAAWARLTIAISGVAMLRPASVNALRAQDISVHNAVLYLRLRDEKTAKLTRRRIRVVSIPVSNDFQQLLLALHSQCEADAPIPQGRALAPLSKAIKAVGVTWTPKQLRRAGCTAASHAGFSLAQLKEIGGWTKSDTVRTYYLDATAPIHHQAVAYLFRKPASGSPPAQVA